MNKYRQVVVRPEEAHFSQGTASELEFSKFNPDPVSFTTFNAGEIVPIFCFEVLPHDKVSMDLDFVIRQATLQTPTMGNMMVDYYAYFVPNRIVNQSFKTAMGENPNGSWTAPQVSLAPLWDSSRAGSSITSIQIPVGSVADHYDFATQAPFPVSLLEQMHDLKFRGYIEIYNNYFRDQNYQPPIPYSKLNVYEGFFHSDLGYSIGRVVVSTAQDNSYGNGSIAQAVYGNLPINSSASANLIVDSSHGRFNALGAPLKANKLHDYFTSVLPSPQKGPLVLIPLEYPSVVPVFARGSSNYSSNKTSDYMSWRTIDGSISGASNFFPAFAGSAASPEYSGTAAIPASGTPTAGVVPSNLKAFFADGDFTVSISDIRQAAAIQQVYEALAQSGSRYFEYVRAFFGLDVDNPYKDIPTELGHFRRNLDLYQTAQTSSSQEGSTPQGNLAAFGYTDNSGRLFGDTTFLEHGYVHVFCVVRQKNIYTSFCPKDNFRRSLLDFYQPQMANLSEQPVRTYEINPFYSGDTTIFGYQEPYAEYRFFPDRVSGYMRSGIENSLDVWNYADEFSSEISISTAEWRQSNAKEVMDRTLAVDSSLAPQFKAQFGFKLHFTRPMPLFGVSGMDII